MFDPAIGRGDGGRSSGYFPPPPSHWAGAAHKEYATNPVDAFASPP